MRVIRVKQTNLQHDGVIRRRFGECRPWFGGPASLWRVQEAVFGVLALESEPVDPGAVSAGGLRPQPRPGLVPSGLAGHRAGHGGQGTPVWAGGDRGA